MLFKLKTKSSDGDYRNIRYLNKEFADNGRLLANDLDFEDKSLLTHNNTSLNFRKSTATFYSRKRFDMEI